MMKKTITVLLTAVMLLSLVPAGVFAGDDAESYDLWIGDAEVTSACTSGEGWSYDAATNTLTLDNYYFRGTGHGLAAIICNSEETLNLVVNGVNTIEHPTAELHSRETRGISVASSLVITGNGKLNVNSGASVGSDSIAIFTQKDLTVKNVKLNCTTNDANKSTYAIKSHGKVRIEGAEVYTKNGQGLLDGCSVYASGGVEVSGGSRLICRQKPQLSLQGYYGLYIQGDSSFKDCVVDIASNSALAKYEYGCYAPVDCKILIEDSVRMFSAYGSSGAFSDSITVVNALEGRGWDNAGGSGDGTPIPVNTTGANLSYKRVEFPVFDRYPLWIGEDQVTSISDSGEGWSFDAATNTLTLDNFTYEDAGREFYSGLNGHVNVNAAVSYLGEDTLNVVVKGVNDIKQTGADNNNADCIFCKGSLVISGTGTLNLSSGTAPLGNSDSIYVDENLTVKNVKLNCISASGRYSYGIHADNVRIDGAAVYIKTGAASAHSVAILSYGHMELTDRSRLTCRAVSAGSDCIGLRCEFDMSFNNCIVDIAAGPGNKSYGIYIADSRSIIIGPGIKYFAVSGKTAAISEDNAVINAAVGMGWDDADGSGEMTAIDNKLNGAVLTYKKVVIPVSYDLWVGDDPATVANLSGEGWSYDAVSNKLTLNGFHYEGRGYEYFDNDIVKGGAYNACGITYLGKDPLSIVVEGENSVVQTGGVYANGIFSRANVAISGSGTLDVTGGEATATSCGILCQNCDLSVTGGVRIGAYGSFGANSSGISASTFSSADSEVCAAGGEGAVSDSYGIVGMGGITVTGGKIVARAGKAPWVSCGMATGMGDVTLNGCTVDAEGGESEQTGCGIGALFSGTLIIGDDVVSVSLSGETWAAPMPVKNSAEGAMGWDNAAGDGKGTPVAVDTDGADLKEYKRLEFPHTHDYTVKNTTAEYYHAPANCTSGETYYLACEHCGAKSTQTFEVGEALGHDFGDWYTTVEQVGLTDGEESRVCSRCKTVETRTIPAPEFIPGDVTGDGVVNAKDVVALMKALVGGTAQGISAGDFNGNGVVNAKDVVALMKHLVFLARQSTNK